MHGRGIAGKICIGGILTAFAVIFQASPVLLPVAGLLLSPLSTMPAALAAYISPYTGMAALLSSFILLLFISPEEALIFILTTGPLGFTTGVLSGKGFIESTLAAALVLSAGISVLVGLAGFAAFGSITPNRITAASVLVFLLFSLAYSGIWTYLVRIMIKLLEKAGFRLM